MQLFILFPHYDCVQLHSLGYIFSILYLCPSWKHMIAIGKSVTDSTQYANEHTKLVYPSNLSKLLCMIAWYKINSIINPLLCKCITKLHSVVMTIICYILLYIHDIQWFICVIVQIKHMQIFFLFIALCVTIYTMQHFEL